jgi:iron complex outermembrane receptor protein
MTAFSGRTWSEAALLCCLAVLAIPPAAVAGPVNPGSSPPSDSFESQLAELGIEQLMDQEVTSAAKKNQKYAEVPASISTITAEEIRRSGAMSVPEALRLIPGVEVARIDNTQWAISIRGFNSVYSNKLLVLIDGRSIYSTLFSGVYWDTEDVVLEDIERIEVIRGPAGTIWGANAVNGVINIITKSAKDTVGALVSGGGGSEDRAFGTARYGADLGDNSYLRVYGKGFQRDETKRESGDDSFDSQEQYRAGFRFDKDISSDTDLTFQGDAYQGRSEQELILPALNPPYQTDGQFQSHVDGFNVLGVIRHDLAADNHVSFQSYFNRDTRSDGLVGSNINVFDAEFQHRYQGFEAQDIVWGAGYRNVSDDIAPRLVRLNQQRMEYDIASAFVQDEIRLGSDNLRLFAGTKIEYNDFSGMEYGPSIRLLGLPGSQQSVWLAVSRAFRTPSRVEQGITGDIAALPGPQGTTIVERLTGDPSLDSETLTAYEVGYRVVPEDFFSVDISAFFNRYDDIRSSRSGSLVAEDDHFVLPVYLADELAADTYGSEISTRIKPLSWWQVDVGYSLLLIHSRAESEEAAAGQDRVENSDPRHQVIFRSQIDLLADCELDGTFRFVSGLSALDVRSYAEADLHLGWHPSKNWEVSLVGQNLLHHRHQEFITTSIRTPQAELERAYYAKLTWHY